MSTQTVIIGGAVGVPVVMAVLVLLTIVEVVRYVDPCPDFGMVEDEANPAHTRLRGPPRAGCPPDM